MALLTQRRWRILGGVALAACSAMALYGKNIDPTASRVVYSAYWGVFLLSLIIALGMALIDLRHVRKQYMKERQDLYRDTLGDERFRRGLSDAHRKSRQDSGKGE